MVMNMKIVILGTLKEVIDEESWNVFDRFPNVYKYDNFTQEEVLGLIEDADAVINNSIRYIRRYEMENAKNLKYIGVLGTGYDKIDIEAAKDNNIVVTNSPNYGTDTVAEYTIGMMFALTKRYEYHSKIVKEGRWRDNLYHYSNGKPKMEIHDKNLGIIGYGSIGSRVGEIAKAFRMNIYALDRHGNYRVENGVNFVSMDELLEKSDFITIHANLTEDNEKMIDKEFFQKMKPTAYFLNMARGKLVDEKALLDALNNGEIAGAGIDTVSKEPIRKDNPLLKGKNIIITPHMAWISKEAIDRILNTVADNLEAFIKGEDKNRIV